MICIQLIHQKLSQLKLNCKIYKYLKVFYFLYFLFLKKDNTKNINTNLENDKNFTKALSNCILSKGNRRMIKLKKIKIIFLLKILLF